MLMPSSRQDGAESTLLCRIFSFKSQIPLRYLVAEWSEAGRRPAASWNLAYHL